MVKKAFCSAAFKRAGVWAAVLFVVTSLFPFSIEQATDGLVYRFGLFSYLELRRPDPLLQNVDVFHVMNGASGFFIALLSLAAALLVCYAFALLLTATMTMLRLRKEQKIGSKK